MPDNLVIVESPAKAKTIQNYLGKNYKVMSSYGHIRDLLTKEFSIDVQHGFMPIYEIPQDKTKLVSDLKKESEKAKMVWLASDEDREGEAISWHLSEVLNLPQDKTKRIVFHEITKPAILHAIENPRGIDMHLVDAQQARRVLDRIVGFELSPVLWRKIMPGLSAGRVQSVAVRLIAEREIEIRNFKSEPYYRVTAEVVAPDGKSKFIAELSDRLKTQDEAKDFLEKCKNATLSVGDVTVKPAKKSPAAPFTTSTLQQEAARKLGFSVSQTMRVAQSLYEAGHITYMRTDSVNLSNLSLKAIADEVTKADGAKYLKVRQYRTKSKGAQEAHEAIRPTDIAHHEIAGTPQERKLYNLIWKRTIASQMADADVERTTITLNVSGSERTFVAQGEVVKFDGFLKVYIESGDENNADQHTAILPRLAVGDSVAAQEVVATQRFTQQPIRYSEASLVRKLEELGIGRPSTYAPTISTIQAREYVTKGESKGISRKYTVLTLKNGKITTSQKSELTAVDKGKLVPTDIGMVVNEFLNEYFAQIMDYNFTAQMETEFDHIAEGKVKWNKEIEQFYNGFHSNVERVAGLRLERKVGERLLGNDPATGKPVSVKIGRYGPIVQLGSTDDEVKPRFASLQKGQSMESITLDDALKLFELPRNLGKYEDNDITVAIGRFGPYVKHGSTFASIPKEFSPETITLDEAIQLLVDKKASEAKKEIKTFDEEPELKVLNGRFGAYISYQKKNFKIPKKFTDPAALSLDDCRSIVADEANASKGSARRTRKKA